ncbi:MAG: hypothetical protein IPM57_10660 [Oligoflexia bacterium]|nr:hypothetical protein [Oligoflexia bacterium]
MFKMFLTLMIIGTLGAPSAFAYNESPARDKEFREELKFDNIFETSENSQLKIDQEYAANEVTQSELAINAEKSRVEDLKTQNLQLNDEIRQNTKIAKQNRKAALKESKKAARLQYLVNAKSKQLQKIKIANIKYLKAIENAQKKQLQAEAKLKRLEAHKKHQYELKKKLLAKRQRANLARR